MSQLIVHPATIVDSIPMTRRITEIMYEKGKYYSVTAMAARIGIHRETYRNMLRGEREIYTFELEKIAKDLKLTSDRLLQADIQREAEELADLLRKRKSPKRFLFLAKQLLAVSVGCTERCVALKNVGWGHFELQEYNQAHEAWIKAYELAQEIFEKYGETEHKFRIMRHLIRNYIELKDFAKALEISKDIEETFATEPMRLAELFYIRSKIKESMDDIDEALILSYKSLEYTKKTDDNEMIGRAYMNVAHFEYFSGNYGRSLGMLELSTSLFSDDSWSKVIAKKEIIKTLAKIGEYDQVLLPPHNVQ